MNAALLIYLASFLLLTGCWVYPKDIQYAEHVCTKNDGLKVIYPEGMLADREIICQNGAKFK